MNIRAWKLLNLTYPVKTEEDALYQAEASCPEKERRLEIELSDIMKMRLENDFERITVGNKLLNLPSNPNVITILENYFKTWTMERLFEITEKPRRKNSYRQKRNKVHDLDSAIRIVRICREVMDGIRISFDFTLSSLLLYNQEREQYNQLNSFQRMRKESSQFNCPKPEKNHDDMPQLSPEDDHEASSTGPEDVVEKREESSVDSVSSEMPIETETLSPEAKEAYEQNESDSMALSAAESSTEKNYIEEWEIRPIINLESSTDTSDNSPINKDENIDPKVAEENPVGKLPLLTIQRDFKQPRKSTKRPNLPRFSTGVPRIITRSMTANAHSRKKDEIAKAYAILSNLLEKSFAPRDSALPSYVYGPVHLARLFVKLPDILLASDASLQKLNILTQHLHMFLNYLEGHPQWFSEENYKDNTTLCDPVKLEQASTAIVTKQESL